MLPHPDGAVLQRRRRTFAEQLQQGPHLAQQLEGGTRGRTVDVAHLHRGDRAGAQHRRAVRGNGAAQQRADPTGQTHRRVVDALEQACSDEPRNRQRRVGVLRRIAGGAQAAGLRQRAQQLLLPLVGRVQGRPQLGHRWFPGARDQAPTGRQRRDGLVGDHQMVFPVARGLAGRPAAEGARPARAVAVDQSAAPQAVEGLARMRDGRPVLRGHPRRRQRRTEFVDDVRRADRLGVPAEVDRGFEHPQLEGVEVGQRAMHRRPQLQAPRQGVGGPGRGTQRIGAVAQHVGQESV